MSAVVISRPSRPAEPLWLEWLTLVGGLAFCTWLLGVRGVWALLLSADPTGLTLVITAVFLCATLWCGQRSRELQRQRLLLAEPHRTRDGEASWAAEYLSAPGALATDLLLEHSRIFQLSLLREVEQFLVRNAAPQEE